MSKDGLAAAVKYSKDLIAFNDSKESEKIIHKIFHNRKKCVALRV